VVDQLTRLEIPFVLIETNEGLCRELLNDDLLVIQGDAKRRDVLVQAGIERACGICIVIDSDSDNLYITVNAQSLNAKARDHHTRRPATLCRRNSELGRR
jgi:Trk K+ transport system NAD-binding subunit